MSELLEIICIDDEPQILDLYNSILGKRKNPVKLFSSSLEAKAYVEKRVDRIGAIVCDYRMPDLDGVNFVKEMTSRFGHIPFLLVSGFVDDRMLTEISDSISGHMAKPFDANTLESAVSTLTQKTTNLHSEKIEIGAGFAEEAIPKVAELEKLLLACETDPKNKENIQAIYRILHTLKGTGASVGLTYFAIFCHSFEARLVPIRDGIEVLSSELISVFLAAQAQLVLYFTGLQQGKILDITPFEELQASGPSAKGGSETIAQPSRINVSVETLKSFMSGVGELIVLRNLLLQNIESSEQKQIHSGEESRFIGKILNEMQKIQSDMQEKTGALLKVPFSTLLPSMQRNIRDLSNKLKKKIRLETNGEDTLFDHNTLQTLSDSMMHLLRNSLDHGLELPQERELVGKPAEGRLLVDIVNTGESILISLSDDGRGIDPDRVKKKAVQNGLRTASVLDRMNPDLVVSLIFEPGFSTAEQVTEVSGRGVGLDFVKKSVESISGTVEVRSTLGTGTTFEIKIPNNQMHSVVKVVVVKSSKVGKFVIPSDELVSIETGAKIIRENRILNNEGTKGILFSNEFVPVLSLSSFSEKSLILLVRKKDIKFAVVVDDIESAEEVILRDLDECASSASFFNRAAISGRHGVILYLDTRTIQKSIGLIDEQ